MKKDERGYDGFYFIIVFVLKKKKKKKKRKKRKSICTNVFVLVNIFEDGCLVLKQIMNFNFISGTSFSLDDKRYRKEIKNAFDGLKVEGLLYTRASWGL